MPPRILLVEDRPSLRRMLESALHQQGFDVTPAADGEEGVERSRAESFDLVLTDLELRGLSGQEVLDASRRAHPETPVVVMTAYGSVETAVAAMKRGAADFLQKPVEIDDLFALARSLTRGREEPFASTAPGGPTIVGRHPRTRAALRLLERVASTDSTVLLTGESGTGKEIFARLLHAASPRRDGPFVAVNCAAIPEPLLESELFGHERGAFTGAHRRQAGRFERAAGGTLLLDEVGELGASVQGKILRVLEERTFEPVGGGCTRRADVRLVAATNRHLGRMVERGEFRSDLFYRLEVFPIELPPLRERRSDVPLLARHLLGEVARRHGRSPLRLTAAAADLLRRQEWPGNVRQLANLLERAVILTDASRLGVAEIEPLLSRLAAPDEAEELRRALVETGGDKRRAAELLGVSYRTVQRRIRRLDLEGFPGYRRG